MAETDAGLRAAVTLVLVAVWASLVVGVAFGYASNAPFLVPITALVFLIVRRMWRIDARGLLGGLVGGAIRERRR
ncbi:hypothetical protein [Halegenticoccus soli]|uniref:hypothetical protein n=1 Tax=Halegenticoccus soli TaxID=1985678 RepID=UPI000C6ECEE1|nr:hypothetical protein [Halegenticoccus soli]